MCPSRPSRPARPPRPPVPRPARPPREARFHGRRACQALFERRPDDVLRVYLVEEVLPAFGALLKECARARRPYRIVQPDELATLAGTLHHEGVCVIARPRPDAVLDEVVGPPGPACLVALEGVSNPHNLGAALRVCAHFGARALLAEGAEASLAGATARVAEGGSEWTPLVRPDGVVGTFPALRRAGFRVVATSSRAKASLYQADLPPRAAFVFGAEGAGLGGEAKQSADLLVRIPGTGHVQSLNVATTVAVVLGEWWRRHGGG